MGSNNETPLTFDEILQDKVYQAEFDRRVTKALETAKDKYRTDLEAAVAKAKEAHKAEMDALAAKHAEVIAARDTAFSEFKANVEAEKATAAKREAVRKHLAADGANQKLVGLLEKEFDLATIELDGDKIKSWDALSKPVKESYADVFIPASTLGAPQVTPPVGGGGAKNPWLKENWSLAEQTRLFREDQARATELARAAGINL